jgi:polygalacturonase
MIFRMALRFLTVYAALTAAAIAQPVFNVKDYGATGIKEDNARPALQRAIDICGRAGGGTVYVPPGAYTSGQLHLTSGVRLYLEGGATLYASLDGKEFDATPPTGYSTPPAALIYGEDLHDIALEGRGTLDGQAAYKWLPNNFTDYYILPNQRRMEATGKPLMRSFPSGYPDESVYPRLVLLIRCTDVRITGLKFLRSRSWTINPYACKHLLIDGIYVYSSGKEAVWADGIDPDSCTDVRISNSTIETGDDAIVFYSANVWGPPLPVEDVTVTNCRLSSASSAVKFCDGNANAIRRVLISNVSITHSNRGLAFMVFDGGVVEDVVISNVTIQTQRFDWFWWGDGDPIHFNIKRRSEVDGTKRENEPAAGSIRHVTIRDVLAHGTGTSVVNGHPDSWLDDVRFEDVRLFLSHDANAPYEDTRTALALRYARHVTMNGLEIHWEVPHAATWQSAFSAEDVEDLVLNGAAISSAPESKAAGVELLNVREVALRDSRLPDLHVAGANTKGLKLIRTDAKVSAAQEVPKQEITHE